MNLCNLKPSSSMAVVPQIHAQSPHTQVSDPE